MATEEGIVIRREGEVAWVKTKKSSACESCSSRKSCNALGGGDEMDMEVAVINTVGAGVGDQVILRFETASLLKATFLLYIFPILCMFAGALIGQEVARRYQANPSMMSALGGFLTFGVSIVLVRIKGNRMGRQKQYRPQIVRVKRPANQLHSSNQL